MANKGSLWLKERYYNFRKIFLPYSCLDLLGPEHEFSIVDDQLNVLPISDKIIKNYHGNLVDFVVRPGFSFGKEFPAHILEFKANLPFSNPKNFEETIQSGVSEVLHFINKEYNAHLLGTGMHPLMMLKDTRIWPNINPKILVDLKKLFKEVLNKEYTKEAYEQQFTLRIPENLAKIERIEHIYRTKVPDTPDTLYTFLDAQKQRLLETREEHGEYVSPFMFSKV